MDLPFIREAIAGLFSKPSCDMYPIKPSAASAGYRGRIAYDASKCIGCGMCERVCAGGAITRTTEKTEEGDRITLTFDLGSCTFCNTCADFCSRKAITLTDDYHMLGVEEGDLLVTGTFVKAPPKKAVKPAVPAEAAKPAPVPAAPTENAAPAAAVKPRDDGKPVSDPSRCVYCTICARKCPAGALAVDRAAKTWKLNDEACIGCGTCADACPKKCIIM